MDILEIFFKIIFNYNPFVIFGMVVFDIYCLHTLKFGDEKLIKGIGTSLKIFLVLFLLTVLLAVMADGWSAVFLVAFAEVIALPVLGFPWFVYLVFHKNK